MAKRPVYIVSNDESEFVKEVLVEFEWFKGFAISQKQKSIQSLHHEFNKIQKGKNILEISTKSLNKYGVMASAFNLTVQSSTGKKICTLESLFQSCKKFENGGPYKDIINFNSIDAKKDERLKTSGALICFEYKEESWSLEPKTHFYDWLYINTLYQNKEVMKEIIKYDAFTDIEFNPKKSINNQARAAALFVSLYKKGILDFVIKDKEYYLELIKGNEYNQLTF